MMGKETVKTMVQLATSGFGLVAALAWNSAIQSLFASISGKASGTISLFVYALFITLLVVFITSRLAKLSERIRISEEQKEKSEDR